MHTNSISAPGRLAAPIAPAGSAKRVGSFRRFATVVAAFLLMALIVGAVVAASLGLGYEGRTDVRPAPAPPPLLLA